LAWTITFVLPEKFEDTKGVIRSHKSKDRHYNDQKKKDKGQRMADKTLHRKLKLNNTNPTK